MSTETSTAGTVPRFSSQWRVGARLEGEQPHAQLAALHAVDLEPEVTVPRSSDVTPRVSGTTSSAIVPP
jgi:hypothetical protein